MKNFTPSDLKKLFKPAEKSSGEDNGQVTIIGGSKLFHGAPLFALKVASRIVDMVFFASPEPSVGRVAELIKSKLLNFIWVEWEEAEHYIKKSDAVLIGPGLMRYHTEGVQQKMENNGYDNGGKVTKQITERFLKKFPGKKWVIDAGSLQVMDADWIPDGAILTPNKKEFEILFGLGVNIKNAQDEAKRHNCTIVLKGPETLVVSPNEISRIKGGNAGMTKGGTGDVLAGLTVALLAKNDAFLAACAASYIAKKAGDELFEKMGFNYNSDDLAEKVPEVLHESLK